MSKKIDWDAMYKGPTRKLAGQYSSGKEYMQKAQASMERQQKAEEVLQKAQPAMEALLKCRLADRTPITVVNPLSYVTSELVTRYEQISDPRGGWMDNKDNPLGSFFQDVQKAVQPGTTLILKSLDPNLQEFIFEDQSGNEVVLPYDAKQQLMTHTNIYQDVLEFINSKGE